MTEYDISIGTPEEFERREICAVCGHPCTTYGQIEDTIFYFCEDHKHLATRTNLIAEFERLNGED